MEKNQKEPINLAVFCSGGDAPGMNAAVRAAVRICISQGHICWGISRGYQGIVEDDMRILNWSDVGGIMHHGGTILYSARSKEFMTRDGRKKGARNLIKHRIRGLICIGGDGSLTGAHCFHTEWPEFVAELLKEGSISPEEATACPSLGIGGLVGSIDNDMCGTEITIGADSALNRISHAIDCLTSTADSHEMTFVVEVMGRKCGWLALMACLISGSDTVFIPEKPAPKTWRKDIVIRLNKANKRKRHCIVIVAEGAVDCEGNPITAQDIKNTLDESGRQTRCTILGHVQRGGSPTAMDRFISTVMGAEAVRILLAPGGLEKSQMVGMFDDEIKISPLEGLLKENKEISEAFKNIQFNPDRILQLRGFSTWHAWHAYCMFQNLPGEEPMWPTEPTAKAPKALKIGVMHIGAAAPGMNSCVRALLRMSLAQGHNLYGIYDGVPGLLEEDVEEMSFTSVRGWSNMGGAAMGTSRYLPTPQEVQKLKKTLIEKFKFDVLIVIGGFEAYKFASNVKVSEIPVPIVVIPATISNNCPGSDFSIGCDRGVNNLMDSVDKIKQSAISSKRVYFIESIGGYCGYLSLIGGLCAGSERCLLNEIRTEVTQIRTDVDFLKKRFNSNQPSSKRKKVHQCAVYVVNEKCHPLLSVDFLEKLFLLEANDLYSVRTAQMGATQQGGDPTPADRIRAILLAETTMHWLGLFIKGAHHSLRVGIGHVGSKRSYLDLTDLSKSCDVGLRLPLNQKWLKYAPLFNLTTGMSEPYEYANPEERVYPPAEGQIFE